MHLIIPFASDPSDACLAALAHLQLPHLQKLLKTLQPQPLTQGDALSLSPPHECALADALGLPVVDGLLPWAALKASTRPDLAPRGGAWGFITLCHWQVNAARVAMRELPMQALSAEESDALLQAMRPYFEEDGIALFTDQPGRWLAHGAPLDSIPTTAPDRVLGRDLEAWMPRMAQAATLRRLQNEMQMLLYTHPVNDARAERGLSVVNSFWLSGTGSLPQGYVQPKAETRALVLDSLRDPALRQDWPAWVNAWQQLDATKLLAAWQAQAAGEDVQLTLCGECHRQHWRSQRRSVWHKIGGLFATQRLPDVLIQLSK